MKLPTKRVCFRCKTEKPITDFYRSNVRYYQRECIACTKERRQRWWKSELGRRSSANTKLKARFGVTIEEYEAMVLAVGGHCQICGVDVSYNGHRLALDHNHQTGHLRGILCKACNAGIGRLKDDPALLRRAADYIERHDVQPMRSYEKLQDAQGNH